MRTNTDAFFKLVRAGLWEEEAVLSQSGTIDFDELCRLAEEQSVVGLVAAGLDYVADLEVPQETFLTFVGKALQIEQRNKEMNSFVEYLFREMQRSDIYSILIKGQGIALCYERPLWRTAGDVDLLLNGDNYNKAKEWLTLIGQISEEELPYKKHITYLVNGWDVELHGTMRGELGRRIDKVIDEVQRDVFYGGNVRSWHNGSASVFLPSSNNDVIFVFTHIIQHFFRGGIGLRQICDWCRLLWTYRSELDLRLLESRIKKARIMSEWKTFGAFAVEYLGMPIEAMPMYSAALCYKRKAKRICNYVMEVGNFGHNRDIRYKLQSPFLKRMMISFKYRTSDFAKQVMVFPLDAVRAYWYIWGTGLKVVCKRATTCLRRNID